MSAMHRIALPLIVLAGVLAGCATTAPPAPASTEATEDGLVPIAVKNIDKAWKRPGASLAGYQRVLIRPVSVAFSKGWNPREYGAFGLKSEEVEKIRSELSTLANQTFARVLKRGGYEVVDAPGEGVLDVEAQIVDLYVNGPEIQNPSPTYVYVFSAGEMRILVTLRDAVTGTTLYKASDLRRDPDSQQLEWANSVWNSAQAENALQGWARQLKNALDAARAP